MTQTADIDTELDRLERRLHELLAGLDADKVMEIFAAEHAAVSRAAPAGQAGHIDGRVNCMLAAAGLIPGETEGERCPGGVARPDTSPTDQERP